ncbi:AAA family ATPase [Marinovum sp.]|uniref:AAA family ATPase n=1 Tax=Marinovum sp. TaxID=2024839 RepID=UPI003A90D211
MKLRAITLNNVRRFTDPVAIRQIDDGLNLLCEPNEHGKSTLFDAIQALFFKAHGSKDAEVKSLRPHAGGAPEVSVTVETEDGRFTIFKRWLSKPAATVHREGVLIAQSDAAEAWVSDLLGGDAGGPSGLIWVRQGMTELTAGSTKEQKLALEARRDLMTSVGEEVEQMTGGRRMDAALARCRAALDDLATGKNRNPRKGGPWREALDRVEALTERRDALAATADALHEALAERKRARRELSALEAPEAVEDRRARLEAAQTAHQAAQRHAEEVAAEAQKLETARLTAETAQSRLTTLRETLTEEAEARTLFETASEEAQAARAAAETARGARDAAQQALDDARTTLKQAEAQHRLALRAQAARDGAERRQALTDKIAQAETLRSAMEEASAAARQGPDDKALRRLEKLAGAHATALAARDATATQVIAQYAPDRDGAIRVAGNSLPAGQPISLPHATRLEIDGIGTLEVRPGEGAHDDSSVEAAAEALRKALEAQGVETLDAARSAAETRAAADRLAGEARAVLASLAPDGIDRLREALAAIPLPEETAEAPAPEVAEAALEAAQAAFDSARIAQETAADRYADARNEATRSETQLASLRDRLTRAEQALARLGETSVEALAAHLDQAEMALKEATERHAEKARGAPDLASTEAALKRATSVDRNARDEITRLKPQLARLDERIGRSSGEAVEERLEEVRQELESAEADLARIEHEKEVLIRLEAALEAARTEARERYFSPIARELKPLLHLLWPEAELTWGDTSLLPDALVRDGREEPITILSGGTQEQVALLVRLAFARLLAASGRTAPVILDDALVFTDDDRIERMFDALHRQAGDLQIIVLSCRQRAFRALGGHSLHLTAEVEQAE